MEGATALSTALTNVGTVVTQAIGIVTDNAILMTLFAGGLLMIGFRVIKKAKNSVGK